MIDLFRKPASLTCGERCISLTRLGETRAGEAIRHESVRYCHNKADADGIVRMKEGLDRVYVCRIGVRVVRVVWIGSGVLKLRLRFFCQPKQHVRHRNVLCLDHANASGWYR